MANGNGNGNGNCVNLCQTCNPRTMPSQSIGSTAYAGDNKVECRNKCKIGSDAVIECNVPICKHRPLGIDCEYNVYWSDRCGTVYMGDCFERGEDWEEQQADCCPIVYTVFFSPVTGFHYAEIAGKWHYTMGGTWYYINDPLNAVELPCKLYPEFINATTYERVIFPDCTEESMAFPIDDHSLLCGYPS